MVSTLKVFKLLHQANCSVAGFCECVLLCEIVSITIHDILRLSGCKQKYLRPMQILGPLGVELVYLKCHWLERGLPIERQVFPPYSQRLPSFRLEFCGIFAVEIFTPVHAVYWILKHRLFRHKERRLPIWPSPTRKYCVSHRHSCISGNHRI